MIGIVVVSHSRALAQAALGLASEMVHDQRPRVAIAAGLDETALGTDAAAIAAAIEEVDSPDGVLVLMDLGSAVLSTQMALEFIDPELAGRVRLTSAPLVEGLVVAVVTAATGADLDQVAAETSDALLAKTEQVGDGHRQNAAEPDAVPPRRAIDGAEPAGPSAEFTITLPHGLHARPVAALVSALRGLDAEVLVSNLTTGAGPVPAGSVTRVAGLGVLNGQRLGVRASGPQADEAIAVVTALVDDDFGKRGAPEREPVAATAAEPPVVPAASGRQVVLGTALVKTPEPDTSGYVPGDDELARLRGALTAVDTDLQHRASGPHGDIFAAQRALLDDDELRGALRTRIEQGATAVEATRAVFGEAAATFDALADPYLRDRAQDVRSLERQVLDQLLGTSQHDVDEPHVLVLPELDALVASTLDVPSTLGVITLAGGATGHGVIVATGRGIPVLTSNPAARQIRDGDEVGFDPTTGELWIHPDEQVREQLRSLGARREEDEEQANRLTHQPAFTEAGERIYVEANVSSLADARRGALAGADGAGLVRTELLFGDWTTAPTADEQAEYFVAIGQALGGQPITIRTWDVGGDKPLPYLPQEHELNPFLGERGLRTMRRTEEFFVEQLRGIVRASRSTKVRVMFPMVTVPEEVVWARGLLDHVLRTERAESFPVGIMIEVPAAAVRAADFVGLVDFVSIGTNDLTQYTMAVDRSNAAVAHLAKADSPAVLDLIRGTCAAIAPARVAVCGDLASDPAACAQLIAAGVTELSVRPTAVPAVKQAVRRS